MWNLEEEKNNSSKKYIERSNYCISEERKIGLNETLNVWVCVVELKQQIKGVDILKD